MSDEPKGGAEWPDAGDATPAAPPAGWQSPPAAVYGLEHSLRCPACKDEIDQLFVIRLLRTRVNFMSSLPRSGRLLACPKCRTILPGELGAVL
ncbi:MAG: hypothetical protein KBI44_00515 [Thermoanaerobaculia bacterium]|jgi:hypothetical protein|nr:hypothetical protein [Thermoanaerobaculia bacterium]